MEEEAEIVAMEEEIDWEKLLKECPLCESQPTDREVRVKRKCMKKEKILEKYRIEEHPIGTGFTSSVFRATNMENNMKVAIKVIERKSMEKCSHGVDSVFREVEILKSLDHESITTFYDFYEDESSFYLVLELLDGGDLIDKIRQQDSYNEKESRDMLRSLLRAIEYLHDNKIAHRDIKPENLLLSDAPSAGIKLADFGMAIANANGNNLKGFVGTPYYVAPEILIYMESHGHILYGKEVDLWSFGVTMYFLLSGLKPFQEKREPGQKRKNAEEILHIEEFREDIKSANYSFGSEAWQGISEAAKDLVRRLLVADPENRLTAKQALQHPWMLQDQEVLKEKKLDKPLQNLKNFRTKTLKRAVHTVMAVCKMQRLTAWTKQQVFLKRCCNKMENEDGECFIFGKCNASHKLNLPFHIKCMRDWLRNKPSCPICGDQKWEYDKVLIWKE